MKVTTLGRQDSVFVVDIDNLRHVNAGKKKFSASQNNMQSQSQYMYMHLVRDSSIAQTQHAEIQFFLFA